MRLFRIIPLFAITLCLSVSMAEDIIIPPAYDIPDEVSLLLDVAHNEIGYTEGKGGYTKYGEWSGDPNAQWCAEYLCWCVNQTDELYGTNMLNTLYPLYSSRNVGRSWFIEHGRYVTRNGHLDGWGYQWFPGENSFIQSGDYIPQPGDWVFFTFTSGTDTDHVAMVEYCSRSQDGKVTVHVIEGNNPVRVQEQAYALKDSRILGYGTVHEAVEVTLNYGASGQWVTRLQEKLCVLGYMDESMISGIYGKTTRQIISLFQSDHGIKSNGIANITTQNKIDRETALVLYRKPGEWRVVDED